jgi:hypothetical protein
MTKFRQIKSPVGLATFGAFFVPEPIGMCLVLASAIWWVARITQLKPALLVANRFRPVPLVGEMNRSIHNLILYAVTAVAAVAFIFGYS